MIKPCSAWYGYFAEDTGQYDIAWHPLKNESLYRPPFSFKSWEFYTSGELDSMPMMGELQLLKQTTLSNWQTPWKYSNCKNDMFQYEDVLDQTSIRWNGYTYFKKRRHRECRMPIDEYEKERRKGVMGKRFQIFINTGCCKKCVQTATITYYYRYCNWLTFYAVFIINFTYIAAYLSRSIIPYGRAFSYLLVGFPYFLRQRFLK